MVLPGFTPQQQSLDRLQEIHHYQPAYQVRLYAHNDGSPLHDAYKLRDDIMSVTFNQHLADPAATWAITLPPNRKLGGSRALKWSDVIAPMDYIEIDIRRLHNGPWQTILRGFVDNVFEADVVESNTGTPQRRVVINGRNFGKLWLEDRIFYLLELGQAATGLGVLDRYWGITASSFTPAEFLSEVWQKIGKPKLEYRRKLNRAVPLPQVSCSVPDQYRIYSRDNSIQTFQGPIWNLMQNYANAPYTEFLVRDVPGDSAPSVTWRWAPLLTRGNKLALPDHGKLPKIHTIHASLDTAYNVGTSDNDRYTYFWAQPGQFAGTASSNINKLSNPGFIDGDGINLYGYKNYEPVFNMYSFQPPNDQAAEPTRVQTSWGAQLDRLTGWLVDAFIWAVEMREGTIDTHLEPDLCVGDYLDDPEHAMRYYVEGVGHTIVPGQFARTSIAVSRGLPLDDRAVARPTGYDPKSGAPIPGGTIARGAVPAVPAGDTAVPSIIPVTGAAGVVAEALVVLNARVYYREGGRAYLTDGISRGDHAGGLASIVRNGIDCSEFVDWCYFWGAGVRVPPTAQNQYNHSYRVARKDLAPGDMVFFQGTADPNPGETITHSGIFVGGNQMINSQTGGVLVANIDDAYWSSHFVSGGRLAAGPVQGGPT